MGMCRHGWLLLDDVWDDIESRISGELRAVVPTRDLVAFTGTKDAGEVEGKIIDPPECLRMLCNSALQAKSEERVHGVSDFLLGRSNKVWHAVAQLQDAA